MTINTYQGEAGALTRPVVVTSPQGGLAIAGSLPADSFYYASGHGFVWWQSCPR